MTADQSARFAKGGPVGDYRVLAPAEIITTPERAEQLGLTADARRMRRDEKAAKQQVALIALGDFLLARFPFLLRPAEALTRFLERHGAFGR